MHHGSQLIIIKRSADEPRFVKPKLGQDQTEENHYMFGSPFARMNFNNSKKWIKMDDTREDKEPRNLMIDCHGCKRDIGLVGRGINM